MLIGWGQNGIGRRLCSFLHMWMQLRENCIRRRRRFVVKVLERECHEDRLDVILKEFQKPVSITLKTGGNIASGQSKR